jgi:molybdopterin adenylyltransferase
MNVLKVLSVNISKIKGVVKEPVDKIELTNRGIQDDAHAGLWHRQVSLLANESIVDAEKIAGRTFTPGTFAENITTKGIELHKTNILDRFIGDNVELEVTQIGKKCHSKCAIGQQIGDCIMPKHGIFARVLKEGVIKPGDAFRYEPKTFKIKIITLSDRAYNGEYEDVSGLKLGERVTDWCNQNNLEFSIDRKIIPDEVTIFQDTLNESVQNKDDIIFTTGSTGIGPRDIAPEVVQGFADKQIPGIMEMIRIKYGMEKPNALLSRSVAGLKNQTLIFALPGSPKAVAEYMDEITKTLFHALKMVHGLNDHS